MKQRTTHWLIVALSAIALVIGACSDDSSSTGNGGDGGGNDGGDDVASDVGDDQGGGDQGGGDQGSGDQGGGDQGGGDMLPDADDDTGMVDLADDDASQVTCDVDLTGLDLPTSYDDGDGGDRDVRIVIRALDFENELVYVENVSDSAIAFDANWSIAYNVTRDSLEDAVDLPAGGILRIHYDGTGTNSATDFYTEFRGNDFDNLTTCGGEIVIQDRTSHVGETMEWSNRPENIEAFVRWGQRDATLGATGTFADEAFNAGAWTKDRLTPTAEAAAATCWNDVESASWCAGVTPICDQENDEAIIGTGDITDPSGWEATEAPQTGACL